MPASVISEQTEVITRHAFVTKRPTGIGTTQYDQTLTLPVLPTGVKMDFTPHLQIRTVPSWFKRKRAPWKALVVARDSGAFRTRGRKPIQPGSSSCAHTIYRSPLEADHRAGANGAVIGNDSPVGKFQAEEALVQLSDAYKLSVSLEAEGRSRS